MSVLSQRDGRCDSSRKIFMTATVSLSITETAALLEEVAASVAAEVPLTASLGTIEGREAGRIGRVATSIRKSIESGVPVDQAIAQHITHQSGAIAVALRIDQQSGDAGRSLRTLARLMILRRELRLRQLAASIYPLLVIILGYVTGVFVFGSLVSFQSDFIHWPDAITRTGIWLQRYWWLPPICLGVVVGSLKLLGLGRFLPHFLQPGRWSSQAIFCEALAWQLESHVGLPDAIRAAAAMAGEEVLGRDAEKWASALEQGKLDPGPLPNFRPLIVWTLQGALASEPNRSAASLSETLTRLAASYRSAEQHAWFVWTHWVPIVTACIIGGALSISYLLAVVWPLYSQLAEIQ